MHIEVNSCNDCPFYTSGHTACYLTGEQVLDEFFSDSYPASCPLIKRPVTIGLK